MRLRALLARLARGGDLPAARLGEFTFAGRTGPFVALVVVATGMFLFSGYSRSLQLLLELCAAYSVAFSVLALLARRMGTNAPWRYVLAVAVLGAALGGCVSAAIALAPDWRALLVPARAVRPWERGAAFSTFFVGLSLATAAVRQREHGEFATRQRLLESRLQMLAARIEPHFLMNTLANLRYLVKSDPATAYAMLDHLSEFLQGALERSRDLRSTLGHELQIIESYLAIMRIRLGEKLRFDVDVPPGLRAMAFPSLLLQTLVENSITHGIEPLDGTGTVVIRAREEGARIVLTVTDDGAGFSA
ncbi:MAG TPA: histidine kinase, partial [Steroidobacteraceae bacterium]|nr:histidine kinase [Steroidobacteraceae bacterium]